MRLRYFGNLNRAHCYDPGYSGVVFWSRPSGQQGYSPWVWGVANIQSSDFEYALVFFDSQRSAATCASSGTGFREASVLQFPIVRRKMERNTFNSRFEKSTSLHLQRKQFAATQPRAHDQKHHNSETRIELL